MLISARHLYTVCPNWKLFSLSTLYGDLSHSKVTQKPTLLDELTSFGQGESDPAILDLC